MFAVLRIGGKQYIVSQGDVVEVERLEGNEGDTIEVPHVLLAEKDGKFVVGTPTVSGMKAKAKILKQLKGDKIEVRRFKAKVRYRRHRGFRPQLTQLEILSIG